MRVYTQQRNNNYPYQERVIEGKKIREYRFHVELNDCFVLMSDGAIWAGEEETMNYNWEWDDMAAYTLKCTNETLSAARLAAMLSQVCYDLYGQKPGDDTTVAVTRVIRRQVVNIFTGPPSRKEDDERVVHDFMKQEGKKVICGGTSANVASRVLKREIVTLVKHADPKIPPMATMEGLDLVTEGVLTIGSALDLLHRYENDDFDEAFFDCTGCRERCSQACKAVDRRVYGSESFCRKSTKSCTTRIPICHSIYMLCV